MAESSNLQNIKTCEMVAKCTTKEEMAEYCDQLVEDAANFDLFLYMISVQAKVKFPGIVNFPAFKRLDDRVAKVSRVESDREKYLLAIMADWGPNIGFIKPDTEAHEGVNRLAQLRICSSMWSLHGFTLRARYLQLTHHVDHLEKVMLKGKSSGRGGIQNQCPAIVFSNRIIRALKTLATTGSCKLNMKTIRDDETCDAAAAKWVHDWLQDNQGEVVVRGSRLSDSLPDSWRDWLVEVDSRSLLRNRAVKTLVKEAIGQELGETSTKETSKGSAQWRAEESANESETSSTTPTDALIRSSAPMRAAGTPAIDSVADSSSPLFMGTANGEHAHLITVLNGSRRSEHGSSNQVPSNSGQADPPERSLPSSYSPEDDVDALRIGSDITDGRIAQDGQLESLSLHPDAGGNAAFSARLTVHARGLSPIGASHGEENITGVRNRQESLQAVDEALKHLQASSRDLDTTGKERWGPKTTGDERSNTLSQDGPAMFADSNHASSFLAGDFGGLQAVGDEAHSLASGERDSQLATAEAGVQCATTGKDSSHLETPHEAISGEVNFGDPAAEPDLPMSDELQEILAYADRSHSAISSPGSALGFPTLASLPPSVCVEAATASRTLNRVNFQDWVHETSPTQSSRPDFSSTSTCTTDSAQRSSSPRPGEQHLHSITSSPPTAPCSPPSHQKADIEPFNRSASSFSVLTPGLTDSDSSLSSNSETPLELDSLSPQNRAWDDVSHLSHVSPWDNDPGETVQKEFRLRSFLPVRSVIRLSFPSPSFRRLFTAWKPPLPIEAIEASKVWDRSKEARVQVIESCISLTGLQLALPEADVAQVSSEVALALAESTTNIDLPVLLSLASEAPMVDIHDFKKVVRTLRTDHLKTSTVLVQDISRVGRHQLTVDEALARLNTQEFPVMLFNISKYSNAPFVCDHSRFTLLNAMHEQCEAEWGRCRSSTHAGSAGSRAGPFVEIRGHLWIQVLHGSVQYCYRAWEELPEPERRKLKHNPWCWRPNGKLRRITIRAKQFLYIPSFHVWTLNCPEDSVFLTGVVWDKLRIPSHIGQPELELALEPCVFERFPQSGRGTCSVFGLLRTWNACEDLRLVGNLLGLPDIHRSIDAAVGDGNIESCRPSKRMRVQ